MPIRGGRGIERKSGKVEKCESGKPDKSKAEVSGGEAVSVARKYEGEPEDRKRLFRGEMVCGRMLVPDTATRSSLRYKHAGVGGFMARGGDVEPRVEPADFVEWRRFGRGDNLGGGAEGFG
jgi:hypothetical protein